MALRTVRVPPSMEPVFARAEKVVSAFFSRRSDRPEQGTIEIFGERYLLVRAASLSVEFFAMARDLLGEGREEEADDFARNLLFDLAHAVGRSDARNFHQKMELKDPIARLSAGPVHFAHAGWAFVEIHPDSVAGGAEDYYLLYDHPYSFESDAWLEAGARADFPVCIMNAGYSSGWCEESFGIELVATEILCKARGDANCRFIMAHPGQIEARVHAYGQRHTDHGRGLDRRVPDFFARKRLEDELRRAHAELEERVEQRTADLRRANERLLREMSERAAVERMLVQSQKLEALGQLAGGIAHDFNNLLTAIGGYAELLEARLEADDPRRRLATEIAANTQRAASLTQQLLVFSRHQVFAPAVIDLNRVVEGLGELLRRLIGEEVELRVITATEPLCVRGDANQLETALINLAVNARDAMLPGGGVLEIAVDGVELGDLTVDGPATELAVDAVRIRVRDTGQGMDAETLARAFDPYFSTKPRGQGTGLGLATVYGIVEQVGGSVSAESAPGQGTTITLLLPRVFEPADSLSQAADAAESGALKGATVLVVEDETVVRELVQRVLEGAGCRVLGAAYPQHAIELFRELGADLDLVLCDVILPEGSGPELVARMRAERPELKVLFVSGYTGDRIDSLDLGSAGTPFLQKPFTVGQLREQVGALLAPAEE